MNIRQATPKDRPHITRMRLALQAHDEESNPHIWQTTQKGRTDMADHVDAILADPHGLLLVAETDGTPHAFTYATTSTRTDYTPQTVGFINLIYVDPTHRRQGTATALIRRACAHFREHGAQEVNLNYVLGNTPAQRLWNSLGLTPIKVTANTPLTNIENLLK